MGPITNLRRHDFQHLLYVHFSRFFAITSRQQALFSQQYFELIEQGLRCTNYSRITTQEATQQQRRQAAGALTSSKRLLLLFIMFIVRRVDVLLLKIEKSVCERYLVLR